MTDHDSPSSSGDRSPGSDPRVPAQQSTAARLRFPGGRLGPADWTDLARLAAVSSGQLQLLAGGEVEIRGLPHQDPAVGSGVGRGTAHSILASPLAGKLDGRADLGDLPEKLAAALDAQRELTAPAGHLVFGFDDGSGDVLAHRPDLAAVAGPGDGPVRIHVGGRDVGLETSIADTVGVLVDAAARSAVSEGRPGATAAPEDVHDVVVALTEHPLTTHADGTSAGTPSTPVQTPPVGWIDTRDGFVTLLAVVPHGVIPARLAEFLGAIERPSTISADRVIGLHGLTESMAEQVVRVLAPMGMVFDATSPWAGGSGSA